MAPDKAAAVPAICGKGESEPLITLGYIKPMPMTQNIMGVMTEKADKPLKAASKASAIPAITTINAPTNTKWLLSKNLINRVERKFPTKYPMAGSVIIVLY